MKNRTRKHLLIFVLASGLFLPAVAEAAKFCTRTITGVRVSDLGRLQIRAKDTASGGNNILLTICNLNAKLGTVETDACWSFHSQLLAAFHAGSDISIQFRNATLDSNGLWGGTCDSLTHQGNFSSAIATIETK